MEKSTEEDTRGLDEESWDTPETTTGVSSKSQIEGNPSEIAGAPKTEENNAGYSNAENNFDHGLTAWLQVLGAFFLVFNSSGLVNSFGAFQTFYEQNLLSDLSPSSIAWIGSIQSALPMFVGIVSGPLFDAGYFHLLLPTGTFLMVFGLMMTSLATRYWQFILAQGFCVGIGAGCLFVPSVVVLPQYFEKRRALANGIAASGSSIGGVLYPIIFRRLQQSIGFPWATRVLGFVCLATNSISVGTMKVRFPPKEKRTLLQLSAFKEIQYVIQVSAVCLGFLGFYLFPVFVQPYALQGGFINEDLAFYLLSIFNAASTFGRLVPNFFADLVGPINVLVPWVSITALLAYCWIAVHSSEGIIVLSAFIGFFSGVLVSMAPVAMMIITPDLRLFGTRLGMCLSLVSVAMLIGTPIGGAIIQNTGSYLGVQLFCGCCFASSAALFLSLRLIRSGPKLLFYT